LARNRRVVFKQLPKSFIADNTTKPLIYPDGWKEAVELFAWIAERDGLPQAYHTFREIPRRARRAIEKLPSSKPQPIKRKRGSHDPARDLEWLRLYSNAIDRSMTKTAAIEHVYKTASHKPQSVEALGRHIRRPCRPDK